LRKNNLKK